jgi:hypothetical protein
VVVRTPDATNGNCRLATDRGVCTILLLVAFVAVLWAGVSVTLAVRWVISRKSA